MSYSVGDLVLIKHLTIGWQEGIIVDEHYRPTHSGVDELAWRVKFVRISGTKGDKEDHYYNNYMNFGSWSEDDIMPNTEITRSLYLEV